MVQKLYIVEITGTDGVTPTTFYFASSKGFKTKPSETPPSQHFLAAVLNPGNYENQLFDTGTTRGASFALFGEILLNNAGGQLDFFVEDDFGFDGQEAIVRRGDLDADYPSGFTTVFTGTVEQIETPGNTQIRLSIKNSKQNIASLVYQTTKYLGDNFESAPFTEGVEGTEDDLKGKPKPRLKGLVENFEPPLVNTSKEIYQLSDGEVNTIDAVKVGGDSSTLVAADQRSSIQELFDNIPAAGFFDFYLGDSTDDGCYIRVGSTPSHRLTIDATEGANAAARTVAQIVNDLFTENGFTLDATSVTDLDIANSAVVGIWTGLQEFKVGEVIDVLTNSVGAYWTDLRDGTFIIKRLDAPTGSEDLAITQVQLTSSEKVERIIARDITKGIPVTRILLNYRKNYTIMNESDVTGISQADLTFLEENLRTVPATDATILNKHLLAPEWEINTLLAFEADADTEAARLLGIYKIKRNIFIIEVQSDIASGVDLGDNIKLTFDRYGLDAGVNFILTGFAEDFATNTSTLVLWG